MNGLHFHDYVSKPIEVEAIRFNGWSNFHDIVNRVPPEYRVYFVPRGYEHSDRADHETDRSTGHIKDSAPEYLMMVVDGFYTRVDKDMWIVKGLNNSWFPMSDKDFRTLYQLKE